MTQTSQSTRCLAHALAAFLRLLAERKVYSYKEQALASGVTRNVIYNFAKRSTDPLSIKTSDLIDLMKWYEDTDFQSKFFPYEVRESAKEVERQIAGTTASSIPSALSLETFSLPHSAIANAKELLRNYIIGFRVRGTTRRIQVSIHRFSLSADEKLLHWNMTFLQGAAAAAKQQEPDRYNQDLAEVDGFAVFEPPMLTCVGRRRGVEALSFLNMNTATRFEGGDLLRGVYSTYSRYEGIARVMYFIDSGVDKEVPSSHFTGMYGDIKIEKLKQQHPDVALALTSEFRGFSVNDSTVEPLPGSKSLES